MPPRIVSIDKSVVDRSLVRPEHYPHVSAQFLDVSPYSQPPILLYLGLLSIFQGINGVLQRHTRVTALLSKIFRRLPAH